MPEPLELRIVLELQAALLAIAIGAGYHYDVAALRVKLDPDQDVEALLRDQDPEPRPFLLLEVKPEIWDYTEMPNQLYLHLPVTIHWISNTIPTDDASRLTAFFRGCADIEQAITVDITRGGLASDTRILKREFDLVVEGTQVWALVDTVITLRRTFGQPNG